MDPKASVPHTTPQRRPNAWRIEFIVPLHVLHHHQIEFQYMHLPVYRFIRYFTMHDTALGL